MFRRFFSRRSSSPNRGDYGVVPQQEPAGLPNEERVQAIEARLTDLFVIASGAGGRYDSKAVAQEEALLMAELAELRDEAQPVPVPTDAAVRAVQNNVGTGAGAGASNNFYVSRDRAAEDSAFDFFGMYNASQTQRLSLAEKFSAGDFKRIKVQVFGFNTKADRAKVAELQKSLYQILMSDDQADHAAGSKFHDMLSNALSHYKDQQKIAVPRAR